MIVTFFTRHRAVRQPRGPASARPAARAATLLALLTATLVAGCGSGGGGGTAGSGTPTPQVSPSAPPTPAVLPRPLFDPSLSLHAGPVPVPLALQIPTLHVSAPLLGVGLTAADVMAAPEAPVGNPVWQQAFWYRGGGIPGDVGTATIAGHVDDFDGRPALFAHLSDLRPGDPVVVQDTQTGLGITFQVTETDTYTVQQASSPAVLARIYGSGPVAGAPAQPAADGLSHLVLVTCTGYFVHGSYDHRDVVYAQRTS
jgi:Sortase domain